MIGSETPERTHEQRMDALSRANEVRLRMAARKRELKAGRVTLDEVLADPLCGSLRVADALTAIPGVGRGKADRIMGKAGVSTAKRCGGLTARQRVSLLAHVGYYPAAREWLL